MNNNFKNDKLVNFIIVCKYYARGYIINFKEFNNILLIRHSKKYIKLQKYEFINMNQIFYKLWLIIFY